MSETYPILAGDDWIDVPLPMSGGEGVVVPNVAAVVYASAQRTEVLLQRRDKPGETVRGRLEVPGGRWRAGESPSEAVRREVMEETGVEITAIAAAGERMDHGGPIVTEGIRPAAVVVGTGGAYPALHVVVECIGRGVPRGVPDEVADPRWWPIEDVRRMLADEPAEFVYQTRMILDMTIGS